jgi:hypothetical protein
LAEAVPVRLRRFSQLGWHGCQDLAGFVMGEEVERVELGVPPEYEQPKSQDELMDDKQELVRKYQESMGRL